MVAAVSGGADSVCLLHVLREVGASVTGVAHFNHKWRGEASEEDERFVAAMASWMGLAFFRAEMRGEEQGDNLEQGARRARRSFFQGLIRDGVCDRVALGHTRDDQAETVLFRVLRGSGLTGLAGIHPVSDGLIRPLIGVRRSEVEEYLRARNVKWREDVSNRETRFARNRIRHELMPQLARDWNPGIVDALANLADLAYEEERRWDLSLEAVETVRLEPGDRALARRQIRRAIRAAKGDLRGIEFQHVESVIDMKGSRVTLPGVEAVRSFDRIRFRRSGPKAAIPAIEVTFQGLTRPRTGRPKSAWNPVITWNWSYPPQSCCAGGDLVTTTVRWANHATKSSRKCFKTRGCPPGSVISGRFWNVTVKSCGPEGLERPTNSPRSGFRRHMAESPAHVSASLVAQRAFGARICARDRVASSGRCS